MSEQDNTTIDLNTADAFTNAAFEHGERTGNDDEIADLQSYFHVAFGLLTSRQREAFMRDATVRSNLEAAGIKLPAPPATETPGVGDKVKRGTWGMLESKDGRKIIATNERLIGSCDITKVKRKQDGTLVIEYRGETSVDWDSQETATTDDGRIEFVDEDYNIVTEDQVIVVSGKPDEDEDEDEDEDDQDD